MKTILIRVSMWLASRTPIHAISINHAWHIAGTSQDFWFSVAVLVIFYTLCFLIESNTPFHFSRRLIFQARRLRRLSDVLLALTIISHCFVHQNTLQWPDLEQLQNCLVQLFIILIAQFIENVLEVIYKRLGW